MNLHEFFDMALNCRLGEALQGIVVRTWLTDFITNMERNMEKEFTNLCNHGNNPMVYLEDMLHGKDFSCFS